MAAWADLTDSFNNEQQISEMQKKYENCYLFVKPEGKGPILCLYKGYDDGYHKFSDIHGMLIRIHHNTNAEIICLHPEKGLFNAIGRMFYYSKLPNRQYRRGVCKDNCLIVDPVLSLWIEKSFFNGDVLQYAFNTIYLPLKEVLQNLRSRLSVSLAFSKDFGISQSITKDRSQLLLWYHDTCIGYITDKDVIVVCNPYFEQEVIDNIKLFAPYKVEFHA